MRKVAKKALRTLRLGFIARSPRWLLFTAVGIRTQIRVQISGVPITVRSATPDLEVAMSCLGNEFDSLFVALPTAQYGLIIDAGGYIGVAAIAFARKYPGATVVTLEPNADNYRLLSRNVASFPNIVAMNKALAPESGVSTLYDRGTGAWGFTLVQRAADRATTGIGKVDCITVREIIEHVGAHGVDLFKIDIEGGEHALLSRNIGWINDTAGICIELHDRIMPGCSEVWQVATSGRKNFKSNGEKYISLRTA